MRKFFFVSLLFVLASITLYAADTLDVYFLNVGHGDAILIDCGSWEALIDAGGPSSYCSGLCGRPEDCGGVCIGYYIPLLRSVIDGDLELAILTDDHEDHFAGFSLIFGLLTIGEFLQGERLAPQNTADSYEVFLRCLAGQSFVPNPLTRGDRIEAGGLLFTVLNPAIPEPYNTDHNRDSLVLLMEYRDVALLLTGDIHTPTESAMGQIDLPDRCLVLKVAHHGSDLSTSSAFLDWADPEVAIVSCDSDDLDVDVAENLAAAGIPYFQTWLSGTICISTDGESIWVTTDSLSGQLVDCTD